MGSYPQQIEKPLRLGLSMCAAIAAVGILTWPSSVVITSVTDSSEVAIVDTVNFSLEDKDLIGEDIGFIKNVVRQQVKPELRPKSNAVKRPIVQKQNAQPVVKMASLTLPHETPQSQTFEARPSVMRNPTPHISSSLLGSMQVKFEDWHSVSAWSSSVDEINQDIAHIQRCMSQRDCQNVQLQSWAQHLNALGSASKFEQMSRINLSANSRPYARDRVQYGQNDYWASPREMLSTAGDCEDYAILKFASLRALGFAQDDLRLVLGKLTDGTPHAILAVKLGGEEYILDNRSDHIMLSLQRKDYTPSYSVNMRHRWTHFYPKKPSIGT